MFAALTLASAADLTPTLKSTPIFAPPSELGAELTRLRTFLIEMADTDKASKPKHSGKNKTTLSESPTGQPAKSSATQTEDGMLALSSGAAVEPDMIDGNAPPDGSGSESIASSTSFGLREADDTHLLQTLSSSCAFSLLSSPHLVWEGSSGVSTDKTSRWAIKPCRVSPALLSPSICTGLIPPADGQESSGDEGKGLAGIFRRKKDRPSPLPLSNIRNGNDPTLPPYSPFSAGAGQSPWLGGNFTLQTAQAANKDVENQVDSDTKSVKSMRSCSRGRREAAERAGAPFSPFVPFSPVNAAPSADIEKGQAGAAKDDTSDDEEATGPPGRRLTSKPSSSLHYSFSMPQPSPVRYMDPEAAQAMGIHPDVIKTAEPGISEEEIERRRIRAQRRLEEQQRLDEGSIVEDAIDHVAHFSEIAHDRRMRG